MIIPIRVSAGAEVTTAGGVRTLGPGHILADAECPACGKALAGVPVTLVYVGIAPQERKRTGFMSGAGVPVHAVCALGPDQALTEGE